MSERGGKSQSGTRGGVNDRNRNRGGRSGGRGGHRQGQQQDKPKKESILDLSKYMDKLIRVRFHGGREVDGILKGYDQLLNLVLNDAQENIKDPDTDTVKSTRDLGLAVLRGTTIILISPLDGLEEIQNPFEQQSITN